MTNHPTGIKIGNILGTTLPGNVNPHSYPEYYHSHPKLYTDTFSNNGFVPFIITKPEEIAQAHDWYVNVPITKDWLVAFGFINGLIPLNNKERMVYLGIDGIYIFSDIERKLILIQELKIEYVHELQNAYELFTGQKLNTDFLIEK